LATAVPWEKQSSFKNDRLLNGLDSSLNLTG